jgi:AraC-like DNA-binding protein
MSVHSVVNGSTQIAPAGMLAAGIGAIEEAAVPARPIKIGLQHLDIVLSISVEPRTGATVPDKPVIDRLLDQLATHVLALNANSTEPTQRGALQKWRLKRVMAFIEENIAESISLADLARASGLSRMYFAACFKAATGMKPHDYVLRRRVDLAKDKLEKTGESLVNVALDVGFQTQAHFTTVFKRMTGTTPGQWRAAHLSLA